MNVHGPIPPTPRSVAAQIARLPELPIGEFKALWKRLYDREAPTYGRRFLEKRIAYKLQAIEFRKVNPELLSAPGRPISQASGPRAGSSCPTTKTTRPTRAGIWIAPALTRLLGDIEKGVIDVVVA